MDKKEQIELKLKKLNEQFEIIKKLQACIKEPKNELTIHNLSGAIYSLAKDLIELSLDIESLKK